MVSWELREEAFGYTTCRRCEGGQCVCKDVKNVCVFLYICVCVHVCRLVSSCLATSQLMSCNIYMCV